MFFLSIAISIAASTAAPHARPTAVPSAAHVALASQAPADEYFGPLRISAIGIRMRIDVLGRRYTARTENDGDLVHDAGDVETALKIWNERYPRDTWAAPTAYHLAQLYQEIQTTDARARARAALTYVASTYPDSKFAHFARLRLAQGVPALHDESPVMPTAAPGASTAPASVASPSTLPATAAPNASNVPSSNRP
ncbi:MAG: hypothetical protein IAI50_06475 [Candidatus Eremiobacteraeota bacterium]|nr:hypothetical protein [Candidatus Eremiobacteraeota bacterium]